MKHLKLLEEAGPIVSRKVGREKFHYLNPVPIQQLYDRWVSKYAKPWATAVTGLKYALEASLEDESMIETSRQSKPRRTCCRSSSAPPRSASGRR